MATDYVIGLLVSIGMLVYLPINGLIPKRAHCRHVGGGVAESDSKRSLFAKSSLLLMNPPADLSHNIPLTHSIITSMDQTPRNVLGQIILCSCSCRRTRMPQFSTQSANSASKILR